MIIACCVLQLPSITLPSCKIWMLGGCFGAVKSQSHVLGPCPFLLQSCRTDDHRLLRSTVAVVLDARRHCSRKLEAVQSPPQLRLHQTFSAAA
mmetsp:Transcript_56637/g.183500  ORF Transcript_56637/g.183500 Transcript_56637/m.183500 type:complete len:93 (+) Transcript_56637:690-968(+)